MSSAKIWPQVVTTPELAKLTAGGDNYIRTKMNEVKGLAIKENLNPGAPDIVLVGKGRHVLARAKRLFSSGAVVPTYVKRGTNRWEYHGQYRASAFRCDAKTIQRYGQSRPQGSVAGVLFLESMDEPLVRISGGGFADPQTRKEIENAAVQFVAAHLKADHYTVIDRQRENKGYDLLATKQGKSLLVEVKGTDADLPRFFFTRNEAICAAKNKNWRLFIVCSARKRPTLFEYTAAEMNRQFQMDPLAWECTPTAQLVAPP